METIKKSFEKNFLPVLIFSVITGLISSLLGVLGTLGSLVSLIALPPLYIGFYRFLFNRMEDEEPEISSIFNFYKSGQTFGKSFLMYNLGGLILGAVIMVVILSMITSILVSIRSGANMGGMIGAVLVFVLLIIIAAIFFRLMPYLYAYNTVYEVGTALKTSFSLAARYIYIFLAIDIAFGILSIIVSLISLGLTSLSALLEFIAMASETRNFSPSLGIGATVVGWVISAGSAWANFTAAHFIFEREDIHRENLGDLD